MQQEHFDRLAFSPAEAGKVLGASRSFVMSQIRLGRLPAAKIGRRIFIPRLELTKWLSSASKETN